MCSSDLIVYCLIIFVIIKYVVICSLFVENVLPIRLMELSVYVRNYTPFRMLPPLKYRQNDRRQPHKKIPRTLGCRYIALYFARKTLRTSRTPSCKHTLRLYWQTETAQSLPETYWCHKNEFICLKSPFLLKRPPYWSHWLAYVMR